MSSPIEHGEISIAMLVFLWSTGSCCFFSIFSSTHFALAEVRGCHRSNPLEANVWDSQVIQDVECSTVG